MGKVKSKGGRKISNVKKTNIKRQKLVKAGKLKPKSKPKFVEGGQFTKKNKGEEAKLADKFAERRKELEEAKKQHEQAMYEEMADMMDPEDLAYLKKNSARSKAFKIATEMPSKKKKPEKNSDESSEEDEEMEAYEVDAVKRIKENNELEPAKRDLLPVRAQNGAWEQRSMEVNGGDSDLDEDEGIGNEESMANDDSQHDEESGSVAAPKGPVSVIDILAKRRHLLEKSKIQIGSMAANFLENPEERMFMLDRLIRFMTLGQNDSSVENTVIKLASASVLEIFKDIIPNYKIADHETQDKTVKLKKDTLKLHRFETALLNCVKRFLVKCERIVSEDKNSSLAPHALRCMLDLLVAHPEFNYTENIIQFVVPYLNSPIALLREIVKIGLDKLFKGDKRGQVSYLVVRSINHHLKVRKRERVRAEMLNVLLSLKLYHLENPKDIATAHLEKLRKDNKKHREQMSKKERKAAKARAKLDKELLEVKAEESTQTRLKYATDISNLLFAIYFRLIKDPSSGVSEAAIITNRAILRPVLTGLAKFGHLMSIDYFQDLLSVLSNLLDRKQERNEDRYFLGSHESLLCIHTVLSILSGQGEQLTLDPERFYDHLDRIIEELSIPEASTYELAAKVLKEAFIARRKKVSRSVLLQAIKRVGIASMVGGASYLVKFLLECIQIQPSSVGVTLLTKDDDVEVHGAWQSSVLPKSGRGSDLGLDKDPLIWEMTNLIHHCDPEVAKMAHQIIGVSKQGKSAQELLKPKALSLDEDQFDASGFAILSL